MERTFSRRGNTQPKLTKTITMMTRSMTRRIAELEKENEKLKEVNEALQQEDDERFLNRCDWCKTIISDDDFWLCNCCYNIFCVVNCGDKMVCGWEGCGFKLAFFGCEECDESAYQDSEDESDDDEEQD